MARKSRKASKKTTIIMIALIVILLTVAVSGTVAFLKNRGEAAAADLEEQNNGQISTGEQNPGDEQQNAQQTPNGEQGNVQGGEQEGENNPNVQPNENQNENGQQVNQNGNAQNPNGAQANNPNGNANGTQGNGQQGNAGTAVDNIQETTITRVETVEIPEQQISEGHYVGWTTMSINADMASAKIGAKYVDITSTKANSIEANAEGKKVVKAGDTFDYTITLRNSGNTKGTVRVIDDVPATLEIEKVSVENAQIEGNKVDFGNVEVTPGTPVELTISVKVKENVEGTIKNIATVENDEVEDKEIETVNVEVKKEVKEIKRNGEVVTEPVKVNDVISYNVTLTNKGSIDKEVKVSDILKDETLELKDENNKVVTKVTVEAGKEKVLTATYTVKQSDIDEQKAISNVAKIEYDEEEKTSTVETPVEEATPDCKATKTANVEKVKAVGDVIEYTITVTNTGNVTLENIVVKDGMININKTIEKIEVGATVEVKGTYTVKQSDIDNGKITNVAVVDDEEVTEIVEVEQKTSYEIDKIANKQTVKAAGEEIEYRITVKNTGNTTLKDIEVVDTMINVNKKIETIEVGATAEVKGTYIVKQSDIDNGKITNVATVNGEEVTEIVEVEQNPAYEAKKVANKQTVKEAGEVIKYTITVTNTGNTTLKNVSVVDEMVDLSTTIATIDVGKSVSITRSYTVKQADIDAGKITNIAKVNGEDVPKIIEVTNTPSIDVQKDVTGLTVGDTEYTFENISVNGIKAQQGNTITYSIVVKNTGNTTLSNVKVTDNKNVKLEGVELPERLVNENIQITTGNVITNGNNLLGRNDITLQPEETITLTVSYTLTRNDVTGANFEKDFVNVAKAEGTYKTTKYEDNDDATIGTEYPIATGNVTVEKYWDDANYTLNRPESITVQLKNGNTNVGNPVVIKGSKENATWTYTWTNLDLEDANGNAINYTVYETPVNGYTTTYAPINANKVIKVTNTYNFIPQEITVIKNYTETTTVTTSKPVDVVFVLDTSASMVNNKVTVNGKSITRAQAMVEATNKAINTILSANKENKVGVVGYSGVNAINSTSTHKNSVTTLLELDHYTKANSDSKYLSYNNSKVTANGKNSAGNTITNSRSFQGATYTQMGIKEASTLFSATDEKRTPVIILLTDGLPTYGTTEWNNVQNSNLGTGSDNGLENDKGSVGAELGYYTVLSANYYKNKVDNLYKNGTAYMYTVGYGIKKDGNSGYFAKAVLNPTKANIEACKNQSSYAKKLYTEFSNDSNYKNNNNYYAYANKSFIGTDLDLTAILDQVIDETTEREEKEEYTYTVKTQEGLNVIKSGKLNLTELDETGAFTIKVNNEVKATSLQDAITKGYVKGTTGNYYLDLSKVNISSAKVIVEYNKK